MKAQKIRGIVDAVNATGLMSKALPPGVALAISRNMDILSAEYSALEKQRIAIAERYAEKDADGKALVEDDHYIMTDANRAKADAEVSELYNTDIPVGGLRKITEADIERCDGTRFTALSPNDITILAFMTE